MPRLADTSTDQLQEIIRREVVQQVGLVIADEMHSLQASSLRATMELESMRRRVQKLEDAIKRPPQESEDQWQIFAPATTAPSAEQLSPPSTSLALAKQVAPCAADLLLETGEPANQEVLDPPESLYNYCVWRIAHSSEPLSEPAFRLLVFLVLVQQTFINAFAVDNEVNLFTDHFDAPQDRKETIDTCIYAANTIWNLPTIFICTSLFAMLLIMLMIKQEDADCLRIRFPWNEHTLLTRRLMELIWILQTIYLPACFVIEAVQLFIGSKNAMGVVMNTLAVTFIMEIDNIMYQGLLCSSDKATYQEQAKVIRSGEEIHRMSICEWGMFLVTFAIMAFWFFYLNSFSNMYGRDYMDHWMKVCIFAYFPVYGVRGAFQAWFFQWTVEGQAVASTCELIKSFVVASVAGSIIWLISVFLICHSTVISVAGNCLSEFKHT